MNTYRIYQVDSFTRTKFAGNPAGVVANGDGLAPEQMQQIARELNNSETAFILSPTAPDHDLWIRFFTPTTEVPLCGHATIAAHYVRAMQSNAPSSTVLQRTGAGILPVELIKENDDYEIIMTQGTLEFSEPLADEVCRKIVQGLGISEENLLPQCPIQIVSAGHSKVMIGIQSRACLNSLSPDFTALSLLSRKIKCNGYFVFTFETGSAEILTSGRMFAPAIGIREDPVTGNANGPLGAYLVQNKLVEHDGHELHFKAMQGEAIGRSGIVNVTVQIADAKPVKTKVGGHAVVVFQTEITL